MMKTLIFDFDGTLVDSMALYIDGFNQVAKDFSLPFIEKKDLAELKNLSMRELADKYKIGPLKLAKIVLTINKNLHQEIVNLEFFPKMKSILRELSKKYQLGILTSNNQENIEAFLDKQNFTDVFDFVYASKSVFGKDKTFASLIKKHKLNKAGILYFGDEARDIEACQKVGVKVAAVTWGFNAPELLKAKNPDFIFSSPEKIAIS